MTPEANFTNTDTTFIERMSMVLESHDIAHWVSPPLKGGSNGKTIYKHILIAGQKRVEKFLKTLKPYVKVAFSFSWAGVDAFANARLRYRAITIIANTRMCLTAKTAV